MAGMVFLAKYVRKYSEHVQEISVICCCFICCLNIGGAF